MTRTDAAAGGAAGGKAVLERVEANFERQVEFLSRLVQERSVRGNERGVQDVIAGELQRLGLSVELYDLDLEQLRAHRAYSPLEGDYADRPNLAATLPGAGGGRSLLFQSHVDVVPVTPERFWTRDPWAGEVADGRMYGRGAADMKSGLSAMIFAVRALREAGVELAGDLHLDTVIEEECTGNGALSSLLRGRRADAAIIPEPFGQTLLVAQVGVMWVRITVEGAGAHVLGADQQGAVNAIAKARVVLAAIEELERQANEAGGRPAPFGTVPHPLNYSVGTLHAGDWPSTVPSECVLEVRFSAFPGEDLAEVRARFEAGVLAACEEDAWLRTHPPRFDYIGFNAEGFVLDRSAPVLESLEAAHVAVTGTELEPFVSTATTDARFYNLYFGIPATCYGPIGGNLHAPDEWVDLASVLDTTRVLALTALDWCG